MSQGDFLSAAISKQMVTHQYGREEVNAIRQQADEDTFLSLMRFPGHDNHERLETD